MTANNLRAKIANLIIKSDVEAIREMLNNDEYKDEILESKKNIWDRFSI